MKKELTHKEVASKGGKARWAKVSKEDRALYGKMMAEAKKNKIVEPLIEKETC